MADRFARWLKQLVSFLSHRGVLTCNWALARILPLWVERRWVSRKLKHRHVLPIPVIVSITSYPARFNTLPLTLKCLLTQSIFPDHVVLWIARQDEPYLTKDIRALGRAGLQIRICDDLRSYKKLIPSLMAFPDAVVVTADDDVYYWDTWLEELIAGYSEGRRETICHWAHKVRLDSEGRPTPYLTWELGTHDPEPSPLIFPVGVGGVLYPPDALHPDALEVSLARQLCGDADDIWWYWMARRAGTVARRIGSRRLFPTWVGSQANALHHRNAVGGQNDKSITSMIAHFGPTFR